MKPGFPLAGRPSGVMSQLEFADRAAALAANAVPGADSARQAAADLMRQALRSLGYRAGLETLGPFLDRPDGPAASDAAKAALAVNAAITRPEDEPEDEKE